MSPDVYNPSYFNGHWDDTLPNKLMQKTHLTSTYLVPSKYQALWKQDNEKEE